MLKEQLVAVVNSELVSRARSVVAECGGALHKVTRQHQQLQQHEREVCDAVAALRAELAAAAAAEQQLGEQETATAAWLASVEKMGQLPGEKLVTSEDTWSQQ